MWRPAWLATRKAAAVHPRPGGSRGALTVPATTAMPVAEAVWSAMDLIDLRSDTVTSPSPSRLRLFYRLRASTRDLAPRGLHTIASTFPRRSISARFPRFRAKSSVKRKPVKNNNSPRSSRRHKLPIQARYSGQARGRDGHRPSAIPGHWSDKRSCVGHRRSWRHAFVGVT